MTSDTRTILLIESDILIRSSLADYLRECGYHVLEAKNTSEARQHLTNAERSIDVVMTDVDAPVEGGFAFATWVRRAYPEVSILMASSVEKAAEKASDLCDDGPAVSKPYDHQLIAQRIRRLLGARQRR